ncbi:multicopper oxidase family protein [Cellulomonas sp. KRMCY2]|uniref:multicopper oxidase family protein n=1 Tax=Cellulomonas sp. KRMCY2 TaxID=1304865 RepID=UPI00045EB36E|nr:multicopper oxidase family protein [Cellulomonas sp. KRMCY2]
MSSEAISRRHALELGLLGAASAGVGLVGLGGNGWPPFGPGSTVRNPAPGQGAALTEPDVLRAVDGVLQVDLRAAPADVSLAGRTAHVLAFNGSVPGPTLLLAPGDRLRVRLVNDLDEPTNLHTHGLEVSPQGAGDNPFVRVDPGEAHAYDILLPADHPTGLFWYHPHHHGMVAGQVFAGLYGAIVVDRDASATAGERLLIISDTSLAADGSVAVVSPMDRMAGREGDLVLVNGQARPVLEGRTGATEHWRVLNACTSRYLRLSLDGHPMSLNGFDGRPLATPHDVTEIVLAPGNRADLTVTLPAGTTQLETLAYDRGSGRGMGMMGGRPPSSRGATTLAIVRATGTTSGAGAVPPAAPGPGRRPAGRDLRSASVARSRVLELATGMGMGMGDGGMRFTIDGRSFDPERIDQQVRAGDVEEWTIRNTSPMSHPFHLHVWPMQLVRTADGPVTVVDRRDVVDVPADGEVTVRIAFDRFSGRTVYHCHILDHEDLGMMGTIAVG